MNPEVENNLSQENEGQSWNQVLILQFWISKLITNCGKKRNEERYWSAICKIEIKLKKEEETKRGTEQQENKIGGTFDLGAERGMILKRFMRRSKTPRRKKKRPTRSTKPLKCLIRRSKKRNEGGKTNTWN